MIYPWGYPWDPRALVPPNPDRDIDGAIVGWETLNAVISSIIPAAWAEISHYLNV